MVLDEKKTDSVVESWVGKPTVLKCAILRNRILKTSYKWQVVSEEKDITRNITSGGNKTFYTFIPQSDKDFGRYRCTISTAATSVKHEILVQQIRELMPGGTDWTYSMIFKKFITASKNMGKSVSIVKFSFLCMKYIVRLAHS